jgi:hypothetical protein
VTGPVRLDRHEVRCAGPAAPPAVHLDVQFVAVAPAAATHARGAESDDLAWWPVDALPPDTDDSVRALVSRARLVVEHACD